MWFIAMAPASTRQVTVKNTFIEVSGDAATPGGPLRTRSSSDPCFFEKYEQNVKFNGEEDDIVLTGLSDDDTDTEAKPCELSCYAHLREPWGTVSDATPPPSCCTDDESSEPAAVVAVAAAEAALSSGLREEVGRLASENARLMKQNDLLMTQCQEAALALKGQEGEQIAVESDKDVKSQGHAQAQAHAQSLARLQAQAQAQAQAQVQEQVQQAHAQLQAQTMPPAQQQPFQHEQHQQQLYALRSTPAPGIWLNLMDPMGAQMMYCFTVPPVLDSSAPEALQERPQRQKRRGQASAAKPATSMASNGSSTSAQPSATTPAYQVESTGSGFEDGTRTTVMLGNLPNNYSRAMVMAMIDAEGFKGKYDFLYLPIDFSTKACLGYAFINLMSHTEACRFWTTFEGFADWVIPSRKKCGVSWSNPHQGLQANVDRYRNSPLMHEAVPDEYKPIMLRDGVPLPFPEPTKKLRAPRVRQYVKHSRREVVA